jgi:hypothetical protein
VSLIKNKTVTFNAEKETDLIEWSEKQGKFSSYVKSLIKWDMQRRKPMEGKGISIDLTGNKNV